MTCRIIYLPHVVAGGSTRPCCNECGSHVVRRRPAPDGIDKSHHVEDKDGAEYLEYDCGSIDDIKEGGYATTLECDRRRVKLLLCELERAFLDHHWKLENYQEADRKNQREWEKSWAIDEQTFKLKGNTMTDAPNTEAVEQPKQPVVSEQPQPEYTAPEPTTNPLRPDALVLHLRDKWGTKGKFANCPMCRSQKWHIQQAAYTIPGENNQSMPLCPVICANCGLTLWINAFVAGLLKPVPENQPQPKPAIVPPTKAEERDERINRASWLDTKEVPAKAPAEDKKP